MRRLFTPILLAALITGLLVTKSRLCVFRAERAGSTQNLAAVFTPAEQIAASLLGGFRSILLNILWVRIHSALEKKQYLELPVLLRTAEELQGISPELYLIQGRMMCLDLPHAFVAGSDERWQWIRSGLQVFQRGLRRFGDDTEFLEDVGFVYLVRFDPRSETLDRDMFMKDRIINPTGEEPLDIAARILEQALGRKDHSFKVDSEFWSVQAGRFDLLLGVDVTRLLEPEVRSIVEGRLQDAVIRRKVEVVLERTLRHLEHIDTEHVLPGHSAAVRAARSRLVESGTQQIEQFRQTFLGQE